jgi:hypothetical protein
VLRETSEVFKTSEVCFVYVRFYILNNNFSITILPGRVKVPEVKVLAAKLRVL